MLQTPATLQMIQDIKQGLIPVGKAVDADNATSAENDGNGDNIANTYAKQNGSYPGMSVGTAVSAADATHATDADNDGDGNNIASTYAKGTMVPVRSAYGPYFTVVGSLPFKAGDIAIVIDNSNNTNYEIGGLYKITGEGGGTGGGLAILQDTSIGNILGPEGKYDVRDYYISNSSTSPAAKYGGSWTLLQGRFILGAGMGYVLGATGGEANVTLAINQIPNHNHTRRDLVYDQSYAESQLLSARTVYWTFGSQCNIAYDQQTMQHVAMFNGGSTGYAGNGASHNNMPPYRVAYIWYRVS